MPIKTELNPRRLTERQVGLLMDIKDWTEANKHGPKAYHLDLYYGTSAGYHGRLHMELAGYVYRVKGKRLRLTDAGEALLSAGPVE